MWKKYARAHSRSVLPQKKFSRAHTERERYRESWSAQRNRASRGVACFWGRRFVWIFFLFSCFPQTNKSSPFLRNANFLENEKKKMLSMMTKMLLLRRRRAFSTTPRGVVAPRGTNNVRAFFEKNPDAAEAVPLLVFVSTGEWFYVFLFLYLSLFCQKY